MTITILKLSPGQKIARPFSRASTIGELAEIIVTGEPSKGMTYKARAAFGAQANDKPEAHIVVAAIDTEEPVFQWKGDRYYAFTEN